MKLCVIGQILSIHKTVNVQQSSYLAEGRRVRQVKGEVGNPTPERKVKLTEVYFKTNKGTR